MLPKLVHRGRRAAEGAVCLMQPDTVWKRRLDAPPRDLAARNGRDDLDGLPDGPVERMALIGQSGRRFVQGDDADSSLNRAAGVGCRHGVIRVAENTGIARNRAVPQQAQPLWQRRDCRP